MGDFVANYVNEKVMFGAVAHVARVVRAWWRRGWGQDGDWRLVLDLLLMFPPPKRQCSWISSGLGGAPGPARVRIEWLDG